MFLAVGSIPASYHFTDKHRRTEKEETINVNCFIEKLFQYKRATKITKCNTTSHYIDVGM